MLSSIAGLVMFSTIGIANADHHLGEKGKYEGMKPQNKFEFTFVGTTGKGISLVHDGTYTIQ